MDLSNPQVFERVYDQQHRGVYAAAARILGDSAQAQDVVQDVFLRLWRRPGTFDRRRGEIGPYLRLMARSRALDVHREGQAAGRAGDRLKVVVAQEEPRVDVRPVAAAERDARPLDRPPGPAAASGPAARRPGPRVLGRPDGRIDRSRGRRAPRHGQESHPARPDPAARGVRDGAGGVAQV